MSIFLVYSAPIFTYHLKWAYVTSRCSEETENEYKDWIHGQLWPAVCTKVDCEFNHIHVECQNIVSQTRCRLYSDFKEFTLDFNFRFVQGTTLDSEDVSV